MDNQQMGGMGMMNNVKPTNKWHWVHTVAGYKAKALSLLAIIALVFAWIATFRGTFLGLIAPHYYWDALIFGVLALCLHFVWGKCEKTC